MFRAHTMFSPISQLFAPACPPQVQVPFRNLGNICLTCCGIIRYNESMGKKLTKYTIIYQGGMDS